MRKSISLICLLFAGFLFYSCDSIEYESHYDKSYKAWQSFKRSVNDSYTYTSSGGSWVGISWETTLVVKNGIVIQRDFKYTVSEYSEIEIPEEKMSWTESGNMLGSHTEAAAAEVLTLDDIYRKAKGEWLKKRSGVSFFFETENDGIISTCGYVPNDCMDDCFIGIHISSVKSLLEEEK